jgi:hypothetical protein
MKKSYLILCLVAFFTLVAAISVQAEPTVSLKVFNSANVQNGNINVGDNFNIEVWANGNGVGEDLLTFGFDVNAVEPYFSYTGYTLGFNFSDASDPSIPNNVSGWGSISDDNVLLTTLSFTGLDAGTGNAQALGLSDGYFYGLIYESDMYDINATTSITINPSGGTGPDPTLPTPEPGTLILLGFGLIGVVGLKKRCWKKG